MDKKNENGNNEIDRQDTVKIMDLMFKYKFTKYQYLYDSYNQFIDTFLVNYLKETPFLLDETVDSIKNTITRHKFKFSNIMFSLPIEEGSVNDAIMTPLNARIRNLTYSGKLSAKIEQIQETYYIGTNETITEIMYVDNNVSIAKIPIMVRSNYCVSKSGLIPNYKDTECIFDQGCYYIVKGSEKVIVPIEKMAENMIFVYKKEDEIVSKVYSKASGVHSALQICSIIMKKDGILMFNMSQLLDIPVIIILKMLGIETDEDIIKNIVYDINDKVLLGIVKLMLGNTKMEYDENENDNENMNMNNINMEKIRTKENALNYLRMKMKTKKKISETNIEDRNNQKNMLLNNILRNDLLPHMGTDENSLIKKGYYICLMINKMLNCYIGREQGQDRDCFVNKRVELGGNLMAQQFKYNFRKALNDISSRLRKKRNDITVSNMISQFQSSIVELGLTQALSVGTFVNRKGVGQLLERLSYIRTLSFISKIMTPPVDISNNKVLEMRQTDNNTYGYLDPVETPDGGNLGLSKGLSLSCSITNNMDDQIIIIKRILEDIKNDNKMIELYDFNIPTNMYKTCTKIFLNGEWLYMTNQGNRLVNLLREKRIRGEINKYVSIAFDRQKKEILIFTDGGRLIRPLFRVVNNRLLLTKEMLMEINLSDKNEPNKINNLNEFIMKYPEVIEYVDVIEAQYILIAETLKDLYEQQKIMNTTIKDPNNRGNVVNRYLSVYKKYTHCEIHPMLLSGIVTCNNIFTDYNKGPRNYYSFKMTTSALSLYISNHRQRCDISYLLFHVQEPIVHSRGSKYTNTNLMTFGENCIIAIASYGGYNQEDSLIMNQSSVDRGLFRSVSMKGYEDMIKKSIQTSMDDEFGIRDKSLVKGMNLTERNYANVMNKGYPMEETKLKMNDVIIAKISPIPENDGKFYIDKSTIYKGETHAYVEKVWKDITNGDGYKMLKIKIRIEKIPMVGDKFYARHAQKGTIGLLTRSENMPFTKYGIQPDVIINPACLPTRSTIGLLMEMITGKTSIIEGKLFEASQFDPINMDEFIEIMKNNGFKEGGEHGFETMTCGMTGTKMKYKTFIAPCYYLKLKHMVSDKIRSRARGPVQLHTRQPPEGKSLNGGLRVGEMERDALAAHGASMMLRERTLDVSDLYITTVCDKCGILVPKNKDTNGYMCKICKGTSISQIQIPYAYKLLVQELMTAGILLKIIPDNDDDDLDEMIEDEEIITL